MIISLNARATGRMSTYNPDMSYVVKRSPTKQVADHAGQVISSLDLNCITLSI